VPRRGLEPPRPCERQHLKLVRLPIPPSGHGVGERVYGAPLWLSTITKVFERRPCLLLLIGAWTAPGMASQGACGVGRYDRCRRLMAILVSQKAAVRLSAPEAVGGQSNGVSQLYRRHWRDERKSRVHQASARCTARFGYDSGELPEGRSFISR
jgi:hypothetical protein